MHTGLCRLGAGNPQAQMLGNHPDRLENAQVQGQARRCPLSRSLPMLITFPGYQLPPGQVPKATPCTWLAGNRGTEPAHRPSNSFTQTNGTVKCIQEGKNSQ